MSLILAGVGAAASLASNIYGNYKARQEARKAEAAQRQALQEQRNIAQVQRDRAVNQDYTQRADSQQLLRKAREAADENVRRARAMKTVTGGTDASVAQAAKSSSEMMGNVMSNIGANSQQFRDRAENTYANKMGGIAANEGNFLSQMYNQRAANTAQATGQTANAFGKVAQGMVTDADVDKLGKLNIGNIFGKSQATID
jgi:hypothetical protein